jgi:hypothetical protein
MLNKIATYLSIIAIGALFNTAANAWTFMADFEQGLIGNEAQGASGLSDAFGQTTYSNTVVHSGTKSAKAVFPAGSDVWAIAGGGVTYPAKISHGGELWARMYVYFKSPWSFTANPVAKVFRPAHIASASGGNVGYVSTLLDSSGNIVLSNEVQSWQPTTSYKYDIDKWQAIEVYIKFSATSPVMRFYKDGVLIREEKSIRTMNNTTDVADFSYIFTYWNGGSPQTQTAYIDDIVFTTETPASKDAAGNPIIGVSQLTSSPPAPTPLPLTAPSSLIVK